jgi:hypothetical protein
MWPGEECHAEPSKVYLYLRCTGHGDLFSNCAFKLLPNLPAVCVAGLPAVSVEGLPAVSVEGLPAVSVEGLPAVWQAGHVGLKQNSSPHTFSLLPYTFHLKTYTLHLKRSVPCQALPGIANEITLSAGP